MSQTSFPNFMGYNKSGFQINRMSMNWFQLAQVVSCPAEKPPTFHKLHCSTEGDWFGWVILGSLVSWLAG
jgi:hypothetical protein